MMWKFCLAVDYTDHIIATEVPMQFFSPHRYSFHLHTTAADILGVLSHCFFILGTEVSLPLSVLPEKWQTQIYSHWDGHHRHFPTAHPSSPSIQCAWVWICYQGPSQCVFASWRWHIRLPNGLTDCNHESDCNGSPTEHFLDCWKIKGNVATYESKANLMHCNVLLLKKIIISKNDYESRLKGRISRLTTTLRGVPQILLAYERCQIKGIV